MSSGDQIVDPMQDRVNATMRLARLVAGDDEARYVQAFHTIYNAADQPAIQGDGRPEAAGAARAEGAPTRTRNVPGAPEIPVDSVFSDPLYLANAQWLMKTRVRVVGGVPTTGFEDCVAVGSATAWCCTATLVAPDVAITAGHCTRGGCGDRVFVGRDVDQSAEGQTYTVRDRQANPGYRPPRAQDDISVLLLDRPVEGVAPRAIAAPSSLRRARSVRVVGYGYTDTDGSTGYGIRRLVDVPLATTDPRFGADPMTEFVAGAPFLDRDSCNGDSGGPAYVSSRGRWLLAGATSRATQSALRQCGDGGIYTLVAAYDDWLAPFLHKTVRRRRTRTQASGGVPG